MIATVGTTSVHGAEATTRVGLRSLGATASTSELESVVYLADQLGGPAALTYRYATPTDHIFAGVWKRSASGMPSRDTLALRRGSNIALSYRHAGTQDFSFTFGRAGDVVLSGDWDGDGVDTFAVRRGNAYHLRNTNTSGPADKIIIYGKANDEVFVGDWDGNGTDTLAVRRGSVFYVRNSISSGIADRVFVYGRSSDEVLVGSWRSGGRDSFAVRRGNVYHVKYEIGSGSADRVFSFGRATDQALVGNWDGQGGQTIGVRRIQGTAPPPRVGTGRVDRVSLKVDGGQAAWDSQRPVIAGDGRHVAFYSYASGLADGVTALGYPFAYVRDLQTGHTQCLREDARCLDLTYAGPISLSDDGSRLAVEKQGTVILWNDTDPDQVRRLEGSQPSLSPDGRWLVYRASRESGPGAPPSSLVVRDLVTEEEEFLAEPVAADGPAAARHSPLLSADGGYVAFVSTAPEIPGDTNEAPDIFVLDRGTGAVKRATVAHDGTQISGQADHLSLAGISADGRFVLFVSTLQLDPMDTNGYEDAYLFDARSGRSARVSVGPAGQQSVNPAREADLSADGRFVVFTNQGHAYFPQESSAMKDVFVRDTVAGRTTRASAALDGTPGNGYSSSPTISNDGRLVAFSSVADNLVPADTNNVADIFIKDLGSWPSAG
ncbi:PD40 domain-containing protein [Georgenia soli]|uniref:PD40 domain-containing protein n=1 Tax=Georgenia soli TaxID=638953 RepID=UPI001472A344|nr:PD40 domain-containing protein [Georgenia soli]